MNIHSFLDTGLAFKNPEQIAARRDALLGEHLRYLAEHSPFYRKLGSALREVRTAADLPLLPLTDKSDLADPDNVFSCVDSHRMVDCCLTSGTTGRPVALPQTARDLERLAFNEELSFRGAGIAPGDRVLIAAALDRCFMAGLAYFLGLVRIGALTIRGGSGSLPVLGELVRNHRPSAIIGVPTLLLRLAERLQGEGVDPASLGVKRLIGIGEPLRNADLSLSPLGLRLGKLWGSDLFGTYASTEMATSFSDCCCGRGGHVPPELIVVEIVDDEGRPLPPGQPGEVVATPLQVTGMPLLRFRTGDIATLHDGPCPCGRNTPRLGPVLGRRSQMLKMRGVTLFPSAIFSVLEEVAGVRGYYLEVFDEFDLSDRVRVVVGGTAGALDPNDIAERIAARTRVKPEVLVMAPEEIQAKVHPGDRRKPVTFFDCRKTTRQGR
ncbi:MAG: AMP-binding protein [Deltaproteobacteria bacterium]|nr:AMP-binding protein [Deltaproteobacteria bacterium]